jgi:hypothetical protein
MATTVETSTRASGFLAQPKRMLIDARVDGVRARASHVADRRPHPRARRRARGDPLLMAAWKLGPAVVTGFSEVAGAALAAHPGADKVAFTGSTDVGKLIVKAAAHDSKRVSLELGGKSPNVVFADADLETAIPCAANAIFFNHGQCCCAGSRLYIEHRVYDDVLSGVIESPSRTSSRSRPPPTRPSTASPPGSGPTT